MLGPVKNTRTELGPLFSEAARIIWTTYIIRDGLSINFVAKRLIGVSSGRLTSWLYGDQLPSLRKAIDMEDMLGIEPRLWLETPVRRFTPPAAKKETE